VEWRGMDARGATVATVSCGCLDQSANRILIKLKVDGVQDADNLPLQVNLDAVFASNSHL